ncbi:hypothetical protein GOP47_0030612 [Adiantum capillus-veneris]|nr:hypothetical protein GOP47_0030612 [Adiantum capillus-veneris]
MLGQFAARWWCARELVEPYDAYFLSEHDISFATDGRHICMMAVDYLDEYKEGLYSALLLYDVEHGSWSQISSYKGCSGFNGMLLFSAYLNMSRSERGRQGMEEKQ